MHDTTQVSVPTWQLWRDKRARLSWLRVAMLALLLFPLVKACFDSSAIAHGARPINDLIHRAGFWMLVFLGVTLAIAPFRSIARYGNLLDIRRMLGVGTFCYAAAHLGLYIADQQFDLGKVAYEISHRVYLIIGFTAWLGLGALAVTSTDRMQRRLGAFGWRRLHQTIYAIALLALVHYFQQTKADVSVPTFAASLFGWLVLYRVVAWWQGRHELAASSLLGLSVAVSILTFLGEAFGIAIMFHVSPVRVLDSVFDFDAGIRPGWQVLAAGVVVVALDLVRARQSAGRPRRSRQVHAAR